MNFFNENQIMLCYNSLFVMALATMQMMNYSDQGYRNRYDIIDHGHEKKNLMYFFHRSIFTEIREFATIVLWKLVINLRYRGRTVLV